MKPSGIVTLLSDFGSSDPFVGVMKGAVLARFRGATLVDLTHAIEPGRIADAAFWIGQSFRYFPEGTVHLAVVDPGVGTSRAPIALSTRGHFFVGPDNGVFEAVLAERGVEVRRIEPHGKLGLAKLSRTFHGRDLFAPAAAALASGELGLDSLGPRHEPVATRFLPEPRALSDGVGGEVVMIDRFGNLITSISGSLPAGSEGRLAVTLLGRTLPVVGTFAELGSGRCGALIGSFGQLEIFERDGSAELALGAQRGTPVRVHLLKAP